MTPEKRKHITLAMKVAVLSRDALCPKCFKPYAGKVEFDHVQALSANGADDTGNLQPLCPKCHKAKTLVDNKRAKKNARLRGETGQKKRREARGGSRMQNKGFQTNRDSKYKQTIGGRTELR